MIEVLRKEMELLGLNTQSRFLLAVSGGVDSMVLWSLFQQSNLNFGIAHVNFSLRGEDSNLDAQFVKKQAEKLKVECHYLKADTNEYAKEYKLSTQMAARDIRYNWFNELMSEYDYNHLVTAHHLDDAVETFLINLNRGTGLNGLKGMTSSPKIFRPLLKVEKDAIMDYADKNQIEFREDGSNNELKYERNWFRYQILTPWKERNPQLLKNMQSNMERIQTSAMMVDDFLLREGSMLRSQLENSYLQFDDILKLRFREEVLYFLLEDYGFNYDQVKDILRGIEKGKVGRVFHSDSYSLFIDRERALIENRVDDRINEGIQIKENTKEVENPIHLAIEKLDKTMFQPKTSKKVEFFDNGKLTYPLDCRIWQEGDFIVPLGMKGKKKVSDILIDNKVPINEKNRAYVLCSGGKIVWLIGHCISEQFKVENQTEQILKVEWMD